MRRRTDHRQPRPGTDGLHRRSTSSFRVASAQAGERARPRCARRARTAPRRRAIVATRCECCARSSVRGHHRNGGPRRAAPRTFLRRRAASAIASARDRYAERRDANPFRNPAASLDESSAPSLATSARPTRPASADPPRRTCPRSASASPRRARLRPPSSSGIRPWCAAGGARWPDRDRRRRRRSRFALACGRVRARPDVSNPLARGDRANRRCGALTTKYLVSSARGGDRTLMSPKGPAGLSRLRLPIAPPGRVGLNGRPAGGVQQDGAHACGRVARETVGDDDPFDHVRDDVGEWP